VVGVGARFGRLITDHEQEAHSFLLTMLDPQDGCNTTRNVGSRHLSMQRGSFNYIFSECYP
jgi:hypothetical protein